MPITLRPHHLAVAALAAATVVVTSALPAGACGGLVGENGSIQLTKTSTLAAYHDGVERYVTSFEFTGTGESVGSIIPLPDVPTDVVRGGDWTLQRLAQEVAPPAARDLRGHGRGARRQRQREGDPGDRDRRARHHRARGRRGRGGHVGTRQRLPAHAGRPGGARLLRAPQPDLHGRPVRRRPRRRPRPDGRRRDPDHADDPHRCALGAPADPEPGPRGRGGRRGRRLPPHRRGAGPPGGRPRPEPRPERACRRPAARRPSL